MKVYVIWQAVGWECEEITGIFTDEKEAKKYAKKSKKDYGGWGNYVAKYELNKYYKDIFKEN
jgi:hypothetical protein